MVRAVKFNERGVDYITRSIKGPIKNAYGYFQWLGINIDQLTQLTFRVEGARSGHSKWVGYNRGKGHILGGTTRTKTGTWNIRYGTDKSPKRTAKELAQYKTDNNLWFRKGPMPGYQSDRRYSASSKLLQASGSFRRSFKTMKLTRKQVKYGSVFKLAGKIMEDPERQVLFVTRQDKKRWKNQFIIMYNRGLRF